MGVGVGVVVGVGVGVGVGVSTIGFIGGLDTVITSNTTLIV